MRIPEACGRAAQAPEHEDVEIGGLIVRERSAPFEAIAQVEGVGGGKGLTRPRLEEEARVASRAGRADDLVEHGLPDALPEECIAGAHGLELSRARVQLLEGAAAAERLALPGRPEGHARLPEPLDGERVDVAGG